jgi:hypothetical protein
MNKLKTIKSVYSYYFPEIRKIIDDVTREFPHEIFLKSIFPKLDDFHFPIIDKYVKSYSSILPHLENFKYKYVTNGSSEAIFHLLVYLKTKNPNTIIYVLNGEYEGYKEYSRSINLRIVEIDTKKDPKDLEKGVWFISNPSAINGNIVPDDAIRKICEAGHKVVMDCSYVGLTKLHTFYVSHPNIMAVLSSFSKPFGLFYYRIGFTFSKEKLESLEGNIWFKNMLSLIIVDKILSEFDSEYFYKKYRPLQKMIIDDINRDFKLNMKPSDVVILGYMDKVSNPDSFEQFKRGDCYRFCLTPYFLEKETRE